MITEVNAQESETLYHNLVERLPDGVYKSTHSGTFVEVNPAMVKMLGYSSKKELMAIDILSDLYFETKDRESIVLQEKDEEMGIFRLKKKDGSAIWVEDHGWYTHGDQGEIIYHEGIMRDITERRLAEEALRESEERFKMLFEKAPIGYQSLDENGYLIDVNETWLEILSYQKKEVIGCWFGDFLTSASLEQYKKQFSAFKTAGKIHTEFEMVRKDGSVITVQLEGQIGHTPEGMIQQAHCVLLDITKQKQTEHKITQLSKGVEQSPASIIITDTEGNVEYINSKFAEVTGYTYDEIKGKNSRILQSGTTSKAEYAKLWETITTGNEYHREFQNKKKDGSLHWESVHISPIRDEAGIIINYLAIKEDITNRKETDLEIRKLSTAIDQNPASVVITDTHGVIEYVNKKFMAVSGYSSDELIGKVIRILKPGHTLDKTYFEIWNNLLAGKEWRGEHQNRTNKREKYWESVLISPIKNQEQNITNYIIQSEDISERKKMEKDLIAAKEKAEESDRLKSAFLANMSHEIRTPLNSILGFSDLLTDPSLDTISRKDFAELINSSGENLLSIINDVLDISKIEAGQISLNKNKFSAQCLISQIQKEYAFKARSKGIELRLQNPIAMYHLILLSDESRIKQVLINFVGNALKFTESGYIEIGVDLVKNNIQFHVKDTGIGIEKEFHDKIFERFRQVEASPSRKYGGNGLGLAITKNLAVLLGGKIHIESEPGIGSTFFFTLPEEILTNKSSEFQKRESR